ncbi:sugar transporter SWEET1-like [Corticium candelabrum]|uniref:sugar transporter SWEET1-like n=1 Tax=Corticium candelabrum TaxID=121492 RepID=UPI002E25F9A1|nr:sugar transporter SWEET1-like [Corticium candelabrum]
MGRRKRFIYIFRRPSCAIFPIAIDTGNEGRVFHVAITWRHLSFIVEQSFMYDKRNTVALFACIIFAYVHNIIVLFLVSALLWTSYGIMKSDYTVTLVNAIGLLLQSTYVVVYYGYTINREKVKRQLLATVLVAGGILSYVKYIGMSSEEWALFHLGVICNIVTVVMFGSPLASMAMVVRTKSTKSMSFPISTAMVLVGGIWLVYGVLVGDLFIEVPNFCGVVLGLIQLSLFALYQKTSGNTLSV